jgi:hypothetical protein
MKLFSSLSKKVIDVKEDAFQIGVTTHVGQQEAVTNSQQLVINTSWHPFQYEESPFCTSASEVVYYV